MEGFLVGRRDFTFCTFNWGTVLFFCFKEVTSFVNLNSLLSFFKPMPSNKILFSKWKRVSFISDNNETKANSTRELYNEQMNLEINRYTPTFQLGWQPLSSLIISVQTSKLMKMKTGSYSSCMCTDRRKKEGRAVLFKTQNVEEDMTIWRRDIQPESCTTQPSILWNLKQKHCWRR